MPRRVVRYSPEVDKFLFDLWDAVQGSLWPRDKYGRFLKWLSGVRDGLAGGYEGFGEPPHGAGRKTVRGTVAGRNWTLTAELSKGGDVEITSIAADPPIG
jgi:hypothetical protein